ncbi:BadF/BadG/BcrA/BcrD ATPase family protein [Paracoccus aminophilus]|uniref:BadF/BadG/BcrA/BcrD family ATPase n=1 Tax=Paracoccus aminophilus JCM 7686 TaxID=1367847 RepID=S5XX43_PARAH|nr:BadF/BadG/BcrA/BcrD ATPase family protein [Paracoccus aminophilus]AGT09887.1 BadF/BadG/BcrA/BcrD family ATPase [Paracoccus aminophilus JCM 7686]
MAFFLGLDGGGTGCRAVLADAEGRVLGRGEGGPANIMSDREGALAAIMATAEQALAGRDPAEVTACLGLAGANISGARNWLGPMLPFGRVRVVHDAVTAVAGALGAADGIVVAIGTGSVFSRQIGGEVTSIGGWGPILGDEASGAWIGKLFLAEVLRSVDGLAPKTALNDLTLERFGGAQAIVAFARTATGADFAREARQLLEHAADPAAEAVLEAATTHVVAAIDRLQTEKGLPVTFTGGLGPIFADRLFGRWDQRPARGNPLDGALRLALEMG